MNGNWRAWLGWRSLLGSAGTAALLGGALLFGVWSSRKGVPPPPAPAGVTVIPLPAATATLPPPPTTSPTRTLEAPLPPSPPPGEIAAGALVQIRGTGGEGLRLRDHPGLDGEVQYLGLEAEVFRVQDGPQEADGYTWWYLVAPYDATKQGWAASNYLLVVQTP